MKLPGGFEIRSLSRDEYEDDRGEALPLDALSTGQDVTARIVTDHLCSIVYAADFMVRLKEIIVPKKRLIRLAPAIAKVTLQPISGDGEILEATKTTPIQSDGYMYSKTRFAFSPVIVEEGYFPRNQYDTVQDIDLLATGDINPKVLM